MKRIAVGILALVLMMSLFVGCNKIESVNAKDTLTGSKQKAALSEITDKLSMIRNGNGYFKVMNGESSYDTYIYNSHGEAIAQGSDTGYISVF